MTWKGESNRKKCMKRTKIIWKRETKTKMGVNRSGRNNMNHKSTRTTPP